MGDSLFNLDTLLSTANRSVNGGGGGGGVLRDVLDGSYVLITTDL